MKFALYGVALASLLFSHSVAAHDMLTECERDCFNSQADCYEDFVNPIGANMCSQEEAVCMMRCEDSDDIHHKSNGIQSSFGSIDLL